MKFYTSIASLILVIAVNLANSFGLTVRFGQTTLKTRVMEVPPLPLLYNTTYIAVYGGGWWWWFYW